MESFNRAARHYDSYAFVQQDLAAWLAEWLPEDRRGRAIEVGAGTGIFTRKLLPWQGSLLATDASASMVAHGKSAVREALWEVADANRLPNLPADWIFSSSFLQWAEDPVETFAHWRSRLATQGRILAGFFISPTLPELREASGRPGPLDWRDSARWIAAIEKAGLSALRVETLERVYHFQSSLYLFRLLHRVGAAPIRQFTGGELRRIVRRYDEAFAEEEGVRSTWTFLRVETAATAAAR